ncbi:hypothetical protein LZ24_01231 [Desulfobotulus alkaliphilus]|uniref:Uncharacterized protein n=1 Tax=Desulfobotulus alkaliphilus TaxID=622671 RepID=A0A562RY70_9BACT|nr:hypothetical protein [Desulfobotulus alkaliphilus]TWI74001.1 hypothetical protein LZ24_01231 [Desulfobotulus alkaliphilus]
MSIPDTEYLLDKGDRIVSVGGAWDSFAKENGAAKVFSGDVCGRSVWDYVTGDATRMWLEALFQLARLRRTEIERPYRCDSPDVKRFMRMRIAVEQGGLLRIGHEILATEKRPASVHIQYGSETTKNLRQRCSICGRIRGDGWQEPHPEDADISGILVVIYTVCKDCRVYPHSRNLS